MGVIRRALGVAAAVACVVPAACHSTPPGPEQAATQFVQALNAKDVSAMMSLAATPFHFRRQEWANASAGSGLVRGTTTERVAPTPFELGRLLQDVAKVKIATATAEANPPSKADLLRDVLKDAPGVWGDLNLMMFRQDANDPHLAIVGVDAAGKIQAVYVS